MKYGKHSKCGSGQPLVTNVSALHPLQFCQLHLMHASWACVPHQSSHLVNAGSGGGMAGDGVAGGGIGEGGGAGGGDGGGGGAEGGAGGGLGP